MFSVREFVAQQLGCEPDDFRIVRRPVGSYRGDEAEYAGDGASVRILVSRPRGSLVVQGDHTGRDVHRRVTVTWPGGRAETRISVDEDIRW